MFLSRAATALSEALRGADEKGAGPTASAEQRGGLKEGRDQIRSERLYSTLMKEPVSARKRTALTPTPTSGLDSSLSMDKVSTTPNLGDRLWLLQTSTIFSLMGSSCLTSVSVRTNTSTSPERVSVDNSHELITGLSRLLYAPAALTEVGSTPSRRVMLSGLK